MWLSALVTPRWWQRADGRASVSACDVIATVLFAAGAAATAATGAYANRRGYHGGIADSITALWPAVLLCAYSISLFTLGRDLNAAVAPASAFAMNAVVTESVGLIIQRPPAAVANAESPGFGCCECCECGDRERCWRWRRVYAPHGIALVAALLSFAAWCAAGAWPEALLNAALAALHALALAVTSAATAAAGAAAAATDAAAAAPAEPHVQSGLSAAAAADSQQPEGACCRLGVRALRFARIAALYTLVLCSVLCCGGAVTAAQRVGFPAFDDTFLTADGYRIHYVCMGPAGTRLPTIVVDGDLSHGSGDLLPLLRAFSRRGRRACAMDKPGNGYSSPFRSDADLLNFSAAWYDAVILRAFAEPDGTPLILLGWGGGGGPVFDFAERNVARIAGIGLINVYFAGVTARSIAARHPGDTRAQLNNRREAEMNQRWLLFGLIRGLAVPFGWMPIFLPGNTSEYAWRERWSYYRWPFSVGLTWVTQYFTLRADNAREEALDPFTYLGHFADARARNPELARRPLLQIANNRSRAILCGKAGQTAADCDTALFEEQFLLRDATNVAHNVSSNATVIACAAFDCNLGMPLAAPDMVVDFVLAWEGGGR
jgi:pimeloyl-ACP methyl ester carboxylesterase